MKRTLSAFLLIAPLMAGCGSDENANFFTGAAGTLDATTAAANKTSFTGVAKVSFAKPSSVPSARAAGHPVVRSATDACTTKTPATATDADGDGISTQTRVYNCSNVQDSGSTINATGTVTVTDEDDNNAASGWSYVYDNVVGGYTNGANSENYNYSGNYKMTRGSDGNWAYTGNYKSNGTNVNNGVTNTYISGGTWSDVVIPDSATNPDYTGAVTVSGYYAATFTVSGTPQQYVFSMQSSGLLYDHTCSAYYKQGSYTFTDAAGNTVVITYNCSSSVVKYNGSAI